MNDLSPEPDRNERELWMFLLGVYYRSDKEQREKLALEIPPSVAPPDLFKMFGAIDNNNKQAAASWLLERYKFGLGNGKKIDEAIAAALLERHRKRRIGEIVSQAQFTQIQSPTELLRRLRTAVKMIEELGIQENHDGSG